MPILLKCEVDFVAGAPGRTQLGYTLRDPVSDSVLQSRRLVAVSCIPSGGNQYTAELSFPTGTDAVRIVWDDPDTGLTADEVIDLQAELSVAGGVVAGTGGDLPSAAQAHFDAHPDLVAGFGHTTDAEKRFLGKASDGATLPYLIINGVAGTAAYDSSNMPVGSGELILTPYAIERADAVSLANLVMAAYQDAPLRMNNGSVASLRCVNPFGGAVQDPQKWRDGTQAWGALRRFRVLMG